MIEYFKACMTESCPLYICMMHSIISVDLSFMHGSNLEWRE